MENNTQHEANSINNSEVSDKVEAENAPAHETPAVAQTGAHWLLPLGALVVAALAGATLYLDGKSTLPDPVSPAACTEEAKVCPDGSTVGRTGPRCEFSPCPDSTTTEEPGGAVAPPVSPEAAAARATSKFQKFASDQEYRTYLEEAGQINYGGITSLGLETDAFVDAVPTMAPSLADEGARTASVSPSPDRYSETNVQVSGIDEPDILKTNGTEIFYSPETMYYKPWMDTGVISNDRAGMIAYPPEPYYSPSTKLIRAFPVDSLALDSELKETGELLLSGDSLVVFSGNKLVGYNVKDPKQPIQTWDIDLQQGNQILQARLYNNRIYLVTNTYSYGGSPCPIPLFSTSGREIAIPCTSIYRPERIVPTNAVYNVHTINPDTGEMSHGISFVGSYSATVYMSPNALYVAYGYDKDQVEIFIELIKENNQLFPSEVREKLTKLATYDISARAKEVEFSTIIEQYLFTLTDDDRLAFETKLENMRQSYLEKHKRDLTKTDIVKIDVNDFTIAAYGTVPGHLLNQFSLDEHRSYLRLATTIGTGGWSSMVNENDMYVLDESLNVTGRALGLGLDERIYSARFIGDRGYVVTFRQTDPLYVLDLSNPKNPRVSGELKIPGYSSYLHPLTDNLILGVGMENSNVKLSLFDVANPDLPTEAAKYLLKEYWSEITNTHHAFLQDDKHKIFFIPGSQGGYIFSYENSTITLEKAVSGFSPRRALFIDDYLYLVSDQDIVVLDEKTWERVEELSL